MISPINTTHRSFRIASGETQHHTCAACSSIMAFCCPLPMVLRFSANFRVLSWRNSMGRATGGCTFTSWVNETNAPPGSMSGQSFSVQCEQTGPCLFGLWFVIDLRIRRTPAMCRPRVHFDFSGQIRLHEGFFQNVLLIGPLHVVVCCDGNEQLHFGLGGLKMRAVRHIGHQAAAMK